MVWVRGEHDIATRGHLSDTLARAARLDDADIVVDVSGVTFMDASTIGALVDAHNLLRASSRSMAVRGPSPLTHRLLAVCGLAFLIEAEPAPARPFAAPALDSWVEVPASDRVSDPADAPVTPRAPASEPADVPVQRRVESAGSGQQRRTPS